MRAARPCAQTWPTRPIRAIIPFSAGSTTDIIPRIVFDQLGADLGQTIVVENRGGAGGTIGAAAVAKSDPDGYTILANSSAHAISPSIIPNMPYDTAHDFAAVIPFGISPNVLVVSPSRGVKTAREFVAALKAKAGSANFSSAGVGTATHLSAERFRFSAGFEATHVPFRGGPEALTEVMGGRIDFYFGPVGTVLSSVREGKVLALAVNGPKRSSALPDVPTLQEAGFSDADFPVWYGMFAPAKTPREIVDKLHRRHRQGVAGAQGAGEAGDDRRRPDGNEPEEISTRWSKKEIERQCVTGQGGRDQAKLRRHKLTGG